MRRERADDSDRNHVEGSPPVRALISYAHSDPQHEELVRQFWTFLRAEGVDAVLDVTAAVERQFWPQWMAEQIRQARFVLVVASADYKQRAEGDEAPGIGRGVRWEARQLQELLYADVEEGRRKIIPVILPGGSADNVPNWLFPVGATTYITQALILYRKLSHRLGEDNVLNELRAAQRGKEGRPILMIGNLVIE